MKPAWEMDAHGAQWLSNEWIGRYRGRSHQIIGTDRDSDLRTPGQNQITYEPRDQTEEELTCREPR